MEIIFVFSQTISSCRVFVEMKTDSVRKVFNNNFNFSKVILFYHNVHFLARNNTRFKIEYFYFVRTEIIIRDRNWLLFLFSLFLLFPRTIFFLPFIIRASHVYTLLYKRKLVFLLVSYLYYVI